MERMKWVEEDYETYKHSKNVVVKRTAYFYVQVETDCILGQIYPDGRGHLEPEVCTEWKSYEMTELNHYLSLDQAKLAVEKACWRTKEG